MWGSESLWVSTGFVFFIIPQRAFNERQNMEDACKRLLHGESGDAVMESLRVHYYKSGTLNIGALSVCISRLRSKVLERTAVPPYVLDAMAPYRDEVGGFLDLSLSEMVRVQRAHEFAPEWSDAAEAALQQLDLLPDGLKALHLSKRELLSLKRTREGALIKKQESLLRVPHAWVPYAIELARNSTVDMSYARLALPLLLLTGRRSTEILNGHSTFAPTARATTCVFTGALKKRGAEAPFEIPLLCDLAVVAHALGVLRTKQGGEQLSPRACTQRYAAMLTPGALFPGTTNAHQLRAVYASFAYHLYESNVTFNRAIMRILGHEKLDVSLSYNSIVLHGELPAGSLGPLP